MDSLAIVRAAALAGLGLAFLPLPVIRSEVEAGLLVPVLAGVVGQTAALSIVFADREYLDPKVRVFVDRAVPVLRSTYGSE